MKRSRLTQHRMELSMDAWVDGWMKNGSKKLLKSIHTAACRVITYNQTYIHT